MSKLTLEALSKQYDESTAVEGIDLTIAQGELVALLGPSGCGKTTTLRMVAGFVQPTSGRIMIGEKDVTRAPPHARDTGMVFQSYALFPHMSVAQNVSFGLEMRKVGRVERDGHVAEALRMVRLDKLAQRMPRELSGGQQQRVALARALAVKPAVFLLDEPLSNLDAKLRAEVRIEIRMLQQRLGLTTLMVTHDQEEALTMADRLVVMERGRVRQIGTAEDLYERPADAFVASFVGRCNLIDGEVAGANAFRTGRGILLPCRTTDSARGASVFALRPERVGITPGGSGDIQARVLAVNYLGAQTEYHFDLDGVSLFAVKATPNDADPLRRLCRGDQVALAWDREAARTLPSQTETSIGAEP